MNRGEGVPKVDSSWWAEMRDSSYFLISVSNRRNLELCIEYAMAGFTNSINGFWTYMDIEEGDYVSFLYGARIKNLYKVIRKAAYRGAEHLPPWPPVTFRMSGNTYYFPFRLYLEQKRILDEPMIRPEFAYVAENLLLRGGYRKTHFQGDAVTLYNVSNMGKVFTGKPKKLRIDAEEFLPKIVFNRNKQRIPEKFHFHELILQSLVRRRIKNTLREILDYFSLNYNAENFEILSEKALPEGYVDIFIKLKHPVGSNCYLLTEVKTGRATEKDFEQLRRYLSEFKGDNVRGILVAKDFPKRIFRNARKDVIMVRYSFRGIDDRAEYTFEELLNVMDLEVIR